MQIGLSTVPRHRRIDRARLPCIRVNVPLAAPVVRTGAIRIGSPVRLNVRAFFRNMPPDSMLAHGEAYTGRQKHDQGEQGESTFEVHEGPPSFPLLFVKVFMC